MEKHNKNETGHTPKNGLIFIVMASAAAPAFFIRLDEATLVLNAFKLLAKIGSLCGTVLFFWQFLLGYRRAFARWITPDYLWIIRLHRRIGIGAFFLILLHPVFIVPYYRIKLDLQPLLGIGDLTAPLDLYVPLGIVALILLLLIVASSTLLRSRLSCGIHLSSYALLPLAFIHGFPIGMTLGETGLRTDGR